MALEGLDIVNKLHLSRARCGTADTARKGDLQAAMTTLIRPNFEQVRLCDAVKARPVEAVICVMKLANQCGHQGDLVCFALCERVNCLGEGVVVYTHGFAFWESRAGALPQTPGYLEKEKGLDAFDCDCCAFATTDAECGNAAFETTFFQGVEKCDDDARA